MTKAKTKTTPIPRITKVKRPPKSAPLAEARNRVLRAVDVTRMLHEHQDAKLIGPRNRDKGFGILLRHLDAAYRALHRYSNRDAGKAQFAAFNTAHKAWLKAQAACIAIEGMQLTDAARDRLVSKRYDARDRATERLSRSKARDIHQIASKTDALSDMLLSDFKSEEGLLRYGANFREEAWGLLKSIRRDAAHLAGGRP